MRGELRARPSLDSCDEGVLRPDAFRRECACVEFVDSDLRISAVASRCAGQVAGQTLEILGGIQGIAQSLARNVQRAIRILYSNLLNSCKDHVCGIVGMSMEDAYRGFLT